MVESVSVLLVSIAAVLTAIDQISIVLTTKKLWRRGGYYEMIMPSMFYRASGECKLLPSVWKVYERSSRADLRIYRKFTSNNNSRNK